MKCSLPRNWVRQTLARLHPILLFVSFLLSFVQSDSFEGPSLSLSIFHSSSSFCFERLLQKIRARIVESEEWNWRDQGFQNGEKSGRSVIHAVRWTFGFNPFKTFLLSLSIWKKSEITLSIFIQPFIAISMTSHSPSFSHSLSYILWLTSIKDFLLYNLMPLKLSPDVMEERGNHKKWNGERRSCGTNCTCGQDGERGGQEEVGEGWK